MTPIEAMYLAKERLNQLGFTERDLVWLELIFCQVRATGYFDGFEQRKLRRAAAEAKLETQETT